jgi:hypothetical protein
LFETGLTYLRTDIHLHTHKDKEFKYSGEENSFVKEYVAGLKAAGIRLGVLTNHNKFDEGEYKAIRKAARKEDIFILPGVELTVKEGSNGIHTLIVFNPDEWLDGENNHILTFLTSAFATISNPENANAKSTFDLRKTFEVLDKYDKDYFIVFAHVDQKSGLFNECSGGLLESLAKIASFRKRVLGLQKSTNQNNRDQFKKIFGYLPALVEGSDPKCISDIGKGERKTYLKLGEYSFSAVKFALQDYSNRVYNAVPEIKHGYIQSITFKGGKFDGQSLTFSSELNTLIGIRGSGKSAIIEVIRYILGLDPQTDIDYKISLVKNILGSGGKATIAAVDKHGKKYTISRISGEKTTVVDEDGKDISISPTILFDGVQYYGQKDLSNSADHENDLLYKLGSGRIGKPSNIDDCVRKLCETTAQLLDVNKLPEQINEEKARKSEIEHKQVIFNEKGVAEKLEKQTSYNLDLAKLESAKDRISEARTSVLNAYEDNKEVSSALVEHKSKYNTAIISQAQKILDSIDEQLNTIGDAIEKIQIYEDEFDKVLQELENEISKLSDEFAAIKRDIKDDTLDADTYVQLSNELVKTEERLKSLTEKSNSREAIESAFKEAARQRNDLLQEQFYNYEKETKRINDSQNKLRIGITFKGDRDAFKAKMKNDFKGTGISELKCQRLSENFSDYVDLIEDWLLSDGDRLKENLTNSEYSKLCDKLRNGYQDMMGYQVQNKVEIYYHDKLLKQHSVGQRASALILFILTQENNDIIMIDQPEDDLDNKVIYDEIIRAILKKKPDIQFIFATHNANIPVLGDAERVLVVNYNDTSIDVLSGNIDLSDTHKQIVDIMEGGEDAFEKRQLIYESWG